MSVCLCFVSVEFLVQAKVADRERDRIIDIIKNEADLRVSAAEKEKAALEARVTVLEREKLEMKARFADRMEAFITENKQLLRAQEQTVRGLFNQCEFL